MKPVISIIAPGAMGASLGKVLVSNGIEVRTLLEGRSAATNERAKSAGMIGVNQDAICDVDIVLSVLPPNEALPMLQKMANRIGQMENPPIFVDCNAVDADTAKQMGKVAGDTGCPFVDGGIIGGPAREGYQGPTVYVSGNQAKEIAILNDYGLYILVMDGPVGAASALKMSYAGITKGLIAICSTMVLAADRAGVGEALQAELTRTQPNIFASLGRSVPGCFSKARRWVPEMQEISKFVSEGEADEHIYKGFAEHYQRMADDFDGENERTKILRSFFKK